MTDFQNWTVDQFAQHYAETLNKPANAWGQHLSPLFGQSHSIMAEAEKYYSRETVQRAFEKAIRNFKK